MQTMSDAVQRRFTVLGGLTALLLVIQFASAGEAPAGHPRPWSFAPISDPAPPTPKHSSWVVNPIDAFVLANLDKHGLSPAPQASRLALLRRAYFDLTGLPPTSQDIDAFLKDDRPDAYERLTDRLLDSPHYGERWAKHWLDVIRYADTSGFEKDHLYPSAWKYRDYVIRSFNADKPFAWFLQEQIAGDELWPDDKDAVLATAMYCVGPAVDEAAMMSTELEHEWRVDSVDTTGAAILGLTLGCARCHDHKYDPISQKDYYALHAVFADTDRPYPQPIRLLRIKALNGWLSDAPVPKKYLSDPRCTIETEDKSGFHLFHRQQPFEMHVLHRGQFSAPGEVVGPAVPSAFETAAVKEAFDQAPFDGRRAALAKWITSPDNPLTARVIVNRIWAWHFGEGIVRTPNDFGNQGELATHPELLDWLAREFVSHGWSIKHLHKLIMLSSTYRMQSTADAKTAKLDPENRLLSHFPRLRLDGESIRDAILADAGTLNPKRFGPAIVPPLGSQELAGLFDAKSKWPITKDASQYTRRSVYLLVRRTFALPMFASFDAPDLMASCPRRFQTTVPTQALTLFNSPFAREQARAMAKRLADDCGNDDVPVVKEAWLLCFGRPVTDAEAQKSGEFLKSETATLNDRDAAVAELCLALFNANEFLYID
jgi:hypothetical protein